MDNVNRSLHSVLTTDPGHNPAMTVNQRLDLICQRYTEQAKTIDSLSAYTETEKRLRIEAEEASKIHFAQIQSATLRITELETQLQEKDTQIATMRSTSQGTLNSGAAATNTMSSGHALAGSGGETSTYAFGANHPAVSAPGVSHPAASLPPSQPNHTPPSGVAANGPSVGLVGNTSQGFPDKGLKGLLQRV